MPDSNSSQKPWLASLNPPQHQAVTTLDGPLLVLSGAGTGKTRVLTSRLAELIDTGTAMPWNILAVTFTNKAAREMKERVIQLAGPAAHKVWLGTFHSLCGRMLRTHAELVDLTPGFTILDASDQQRVMKALMEARGIDTKRWPARLVCSTVQRWKDRALVPAKVGLAEHQKFGDVADGKMGQLYEDYQARLKSLNAVDFGDLLLHVITILQEHRDVQEDYRKKITHIMVDEYQDTNVAQYLWLRLITGPGNNLCCVGDDDQSIYGWRGAEVGNILRFAKDFKGAKTVRLEQNYRSTGHILQAASCVIANNRQRLGKTLHTRAGDGEKLRLRGYLDGPEEARGISAQIERYRDNGVVLDQIAVLVRAGFQTREFEERFIATNLPYRVVGTRFYERAEIRDVIAYLRLVAQPADDLALERIINQPRRGIGNTSVAKIRAHAQRRRIPMLEACGEMVGSDAFHPAARKAIAGFTRDVMRWRDAIENTHHGRLAEIIFDESGYTAMLKADKTQEAIGRRENLGELVSAMQEFESLAGFLEHISLVMDGDAKSDRPEVSLMTMHAAKGLEFDVVFLPGWEEDIFPTKRSLEEGGITALEEERRIAYVAITRARKHLHVCFAASRMVHGQWNRGHPSIFVGELPPGAVLAERGEGVQVPIRLADGRVVSVGEDDSDCGVGDDNVAGAGDTADASDDRQRVASRPDLVQSSYGPGWQRMARRAGEPVQKGFGKVGAGVQFAAGDRVFHQKFGMGNVTQVEGDKLNISFDKAGHKKLMSSFVDKRAREA